MREREDHWWTCTRPWFYALIWITGFSKLHVRRLYRLLHIYMSYMLPLLWSLIPSHWTQKQGRRRCCVCPDTPEAAGRWWRTPLPHSGSSLMPSPHQSTHTGHTSMMSERICVTTKNIDSPLCAPSCQNPSKSTFIIRLALCYILDIPFVQSPVWWARFQARWCCPAKKTFEQTFTKLQRRSSSFWSHTHREDHQPTISHPLCTHCGRGRMLNREPQSL